MEYEAAYWNARYQSGLLSGSGSYGDTLKRKLDVLRNLTDVKSVLEIGCGDFNFGKNLMFTLKLPLTEYTGYDLSEHIIQRNRKFYPSSNFFLSMGNMPPGKADLLLCVDVLFHLIDDKECEQFIHGLYEKWQNDATYLALTAYERGPEAHEGQGHVRIRPFDVKRFGEPLFREVVEDDGNLYLYVFKKHE